MTVVFTRQGSQVRTLWCPPNKSMTYRLFGFLLKVCTKVIRNFNQEGISVRGVSKPLSLVIIDEPSSRLGENLEESS